MFYIVPSFFAARMQEKLSASSPFVASNYSCQTHLYQVFSILNTGVIITHLYFIVNRIVTIL